MINRRIVDVTTPEDRDLELEHTRNDFDVRIIDFDGSFFMDGGPVDFVFPSTTADLPPGDYGDTFCSRAPEFCQLREDFEDATVEEKKKVLDPKLDSYTFSRIVENVLCIQHNHYVKNNTEATHPLKNTKKPISVPFNWPHAVKYSDAKWLEVFIDKLRRKRNYANESEALKIIEDRIREVEKRSWKWNDECVDWLTSVDIDNRRAIMCSSLEKGRQTDRYDI